MPSSIYIDFFDKLTFDNRFLQALPGDPETGSHRRQVQNACYSRVRPTPVSRPVLVAYSPDMAALLGWPDDVCRSDEFTQIFAGNRLAKGMEPYATCYGGHQFGHWAGQLGDGRAINLGDVISPAGQRWTLQLKGAGATPYSRSADGLAVLRSSIREFLCSEAMHHLGVPTTRALSVILTGEQVVRDMFYDGNAQLEPGAVVCRVAPSFTRFGHFQIFAARDDLETLKKLVDYTLAVDFADQGTLSITDWFEQVCIATADMIVHWQRVGFVHGVMNTDNLSILGLTIDYGPYGWLENYDPDWTPNTTDAQGRRYRFGNQPGIAYWNLVQLANALYPLINDVQPLQQALTAYSKRFERGYRAMMANKLGLQAFQTDDQALIDDALTLLQRVEADMTLFFRDLAGVATTSDFRQLLCQVSYRNLVDDDLSLVTQWFARYSARLREQALPDDERIALMNATNPQYVLRNYLAQEAIALAEQGDFSRVGELLELLRQPYTEQPGKSHFARKRPEWARHKPGCSMLSCSS
ncbi:MAG: YdiU family protein [Methylomonas sp.]|nr:YdiU family protein [Methylomonas sp.]PPD19455.1 MAG: hypothetical protein CTY23_11820 [Methylomonas sp.]PPD24970.1 MAG: hypothetical protein CTY22_10060 [Methylomonas sp.]PPD34147.1 MAG: hypothetical protein CTY21_10040 [Methylomonas sp.]PPD38003.1 MAG: hypothetical protein CTY17_10140 [Methylomonas sp.]